MKLKEFEGLLGNLEGFRSPRIELEQYETQAHLAARSLFTIQQSYGDFSGKVVADLGCGPGRLSIGAALLEADVVYGFDIDTSALQVLSENCDSLEMSKIEAVLMDATLLCSGKQPFPGFRGFFDTVISNPPFGTKNNHGADVQFLKSALYLSKNSVYSFHKTVTRDFLLSKSKDWHVSMEVIAELQFDLPQTFKKHKKASVDIKVDLLRTAHLAVMEL